MNSEKVIIVGAGFAGVEAAWFLASRGIRVELYEMRPLKMTPAHKTPYFAEPVCSNSFKSEKLSTASGLLKEEMKILNSIVLETAMRCRVPAGHALAVDRVKFAQAITEKIESHPGIKVVRTEVENIPEERPVIIASGPLTSEKLASTLKRYTGDLLYFYDAISPIVSRESIDMEKAFIQDRYNQGEGSYINCPLTREEYERFWKALLEAEEVPPHPFEEVRYFEACLPVEEIARRGYRSLLFGPMKPVGLIDPHTGTQPYAVVQLRQEDQEGQMYSLVGFQTRLKYGEQERLFRMIPALKNAEFLRYGSVHRNTYVNVPASCNDFLELKNAPGVFMAGQIAGVEGYMESALCGIIAGYYVWCSLQGKSATHPPEVTMTGALMKYIRHANPKHFSPMNANFGLIPAPEGVKLKGEEKRAFIVKRALEEMRNWKEKHLKMV